MEKFFFLSAPGDKGGTTFNVLQAGITYPDQNYRIFRKQSKICVVEYITGGSGTVMCDGKVFYPKKGDVYILQSGMDHKYFSSRNNPWEKKWMNISGPLCESLISNYGIQDTLYFPESEIEDLFDEFFSFAKENTDVAAVNDFGAITFHRILQRLSAKTEKCTNKVALEAKKYIDGNIYEKLSAEMVAEYMGFSVSQLGRIFKSEYGKTVYAYILDRKLDIAENLLKNTNLLHKEISDILKFTDEHYFCNIFKTKCGISPGEYRKKANSQ